MNQWEYLRPWMHRIQDVYIGDNGSVFVCDTRERVAVFLHYHPLVWRAFIHSQLMTSHQWMFVCLRNILLVDGCYNIRNSTYSYAAVTHFCQSTHDKTLKRVHIHGGKHNRIGYRAMMTLLVLSKLSFICTVKLELCVSAFLEAWIWMQYPNPVLPEIKTWQFCICVTESFINATDDEA